MMNQSDLEGRSKFERRKAVIVQAAVHVINCKGVRGMTLADVAERLGLVPTAVNYYFRRKEDLASACFLLAIERFNSLMDRSDREATPHARLRVFLYDFADHQAAVANGTAEPMVVFNDVRTVKDTAVNAAYVEMFRRVRRIFPADGRGGPTRLQRNARTHLLISQVLWAVLWLQQYDPADYRRMIDRLYAILVDGLAAEGRIWAPVDLPASHPSVEVAGGSREAFLRAATEMLNEHGYLNASVSRIAARLNVTKGSFYHHIQAKDDLVEQCFDRTLEVMRAAQVDADEYTEDGLGNLAALTSLLVRRDVSGETPLLRTSALTAVPQELQAGLVRRFDRISGRLASVVSDGIADGSMRPVDPNVAAQSLTSLINASAELHHWAPGINAAEAADIYAQPLFFGVLSAERGAAFDIAERRLAVGG